MRASWRILRIRFAASRNPIQYDAGARADFRSREKTEFHVL
jgi:hypothetical protein